MIGRKLLVHFKSLILLTKKSICLLSPSMRVHQVIFSVHTTHTIITYFLLLSLSLSLDMGDFERQLKKRGKELKVLFKKGVKIVENSCKKGWKKVKHLKKRWLILLLIFLLMPTNPNPIVWWSPTTYLYEKNLMWLYRNPCYF